jgi:hypothetical protein
MAPTQPARTKLAPGETSDMITPNQPVAMVTA